MKNANLGASLFYFLAKVPKVKLITQSLNLQEICWCPLLYLFVAKGLFHLDSRYLAQILVQLHFEPVSLVLALEATEPVTQMTVELINNHLISVVVEILLN